MKNNVPCKCSHKFKSHDQDHEDGWCRIKDSKGIWKDDCVKYSPDNLKYIEEKYKESLK